MKESPMLHQQKGVIFKRFLPSVSDEPMTAGYEAWSSSDAHNGLPFRPKCPFKE